MSKEKVSMREAVVRMDKAVESLTSGTGADIKAASLNIGNVRALVRVIEVEILAASKAGKTVDIHNLGFIDYE